MALLGTVIGAGTGCSETNDDGSERGGGDAGSPGAEGGAGGEAGREPVAGKGGAPTAGSAGEGGEAAGQAGQAGAGGEVPVLDDPGLSGATFRLSYREPARFTDYGPWLVYLAVGSEGDAHLSLLEETTGFRQFIELERRGDGLYSEPRVWSPLAVVRYDWEPLVPGDCARDWRVVPVDVDGDGSADQLNISVELDADAEISSDYGHECGQHEIQREAELVAKRIEPPPLTLRVLQDPGVRVDDPLEPLLPSVRPTRPLSHFAAATLTTRTGTFRANAHRDRAGLVDGFAVNVVQEPGDVAVFRVYFGGPTAGPIPDDPEYFAPFDVAFALPEWGVKVDGTFESYTDPAGYPKDVGAYSSSTELTTGLSGNVGLLVKEARLRVARPEGGSRLKLLAGSADLEMLAGAVGGVAGVPERLRQIPCEENALACEKSIYEYAYDLGEGDLGDEVLLRIREPGTCYGCAGKEMTVIDDVRVE